MQYFISGIIFILIISFINCEDRRTIFANNIKNNIESMKKPEKTEKLIKNFDNK